MILDLPSKPVSWLLGNIGKDNIAEGIDENTLQKIGADVVSMYEFDKASRSEWEKKIESGIKVAKQVVEEKTYPWPGAANTKDSLMAEAAAQFAARAGGEVVRGQDVVKVKVTGSDPQNMKQKRAKRVGDYMSYDCTDGMEEWESENDQLLTSVSLIGMYYKKTFRDEMKGRNVSYARSPMHVVVHEDTKTLQTAARITEEMDFSINEALEKVRSGLWLDVTEHMEKSEEGMPEAFLEQHRSLDLDGDGYEEPYVVTVHVESQHVCRIVARYKKSGVILNKKNEVARIEPVHYFTEFPFLLSPDGKFHKIGWAHLLGPNTEVVNAIVNQLLDAGHMANLPPIFAAKGAKLPAGGLRVRPGLFIPVESTGQDLRQNIVVQQVTGPSDVLFKLLGMLVEKGQKLANLSDSMQGETGGANVPATTTLALLDQALKVYTSILKRLFRSYKQEFQKLYELDRENLTDKEYINVVDVEPEDLTALGLPPGPWPEGSRVLVEHDFSDLDKDIQPVMDPTASSEALRLARLNAMATAAGMPPAVGRLYLEGIGVAKKDIDLIFPPPPVPAPPDPKMVEIQAKITQMQHQGEQKDRELALKHMEMEQKEAVAVWTIQKLREEITNIHANSILALANAEKAEVGTQIEVSRQNLAELQHELDQMNADRDHELARLQTQLSAQSAEEGENGGTGDAESETGGAGGVAEPADDQGSAAVLQGQAGRGSGGLGAGELPSIGLTGGGGMDGALDGAATGIQPHAQPTELPPAGPMQ